MLEIIIAGLVVMAASLAGILFTNTFAKSYLDRNLPFLLAFSTGVFLVTAGLLTLEVFHIMETPLMAISLIAAGYLCATALQYLLPESHHHHGDDCANTAGAKKVIVGDAIHNITDGIILVPAFLASTGLGIMVVVSIFIHEVLQEISEFFVLKRAGYSTRKALSINFAVSSTIFIGIAIGLMSLSSELLEGVLLAISAGFFIHVVLHDLIPEMKQSKSARGKTIIMLLLGVALMLGVNFAIGETHVHGEHEEGHKETDHHSEEENHAGESNTNHELAEEDHDHAPGTPEEHSH
jgi:zinc and cadmium transporter